MSHLLAATLFIAGIAHADECPHSGLDAGGMVFVGGLTNGTQSDPCHTATADTWESRFEYGANAPGAPVCEPSLDSVEFWWPGKNLLGTDPVSGDPLTIEVDGCFQSGLDWFSSTGAIEGEGGKVTLYTDPWIYSVDVMVCVRDSPGLCASSTIQLVDPTPRVFIDEVIEEAQQSNGRWLRINGHVEDPAGFPETYEVTVFKHADIFYEERDRVTVGIDGTFTKRLYALDNVDRVNTILITPGAITEDQENCKPRLCWPRKHPLSGQHVPWVPDDITSWDHDTHFLIRTVTGNEQTDNLISRISPRRMRVPGAEWGAHFIRAGLQRDRFHLYTQAMGVMGLTASDRFDDARKVLDALSFVQNDDGSFYFEYYEWGRSPYPRSGDRRYTGANAWIAMAINMFHEATGTNEYQTELEMLLGHLASNRIEINGNMAVRFNPTDLGHTPWNESRVAALEHNSDALSAFRGYRLHTGNTQFEHVEGDLKAFIEDRWVGDHFTPGSHMTAGDNVAELYMQSATWALLTLGDEALPYYDVLDFNCQHFFDPTGVLDRSHAHVPGFSDMMFADGTTPHGGIAFTEGTLSMLMAMQQAHAAGRTDICQGRTPEDLLDAIDAIAGVIDQKGGLPGATLDDTRDTTTTSETVALSWHILTHKGINPFRPWDYYDQQ